jgi:polyhydroxyalkanoate synthesis regulator phasin
MDEPDSSRSTLEQLVSALRLDEITTRWRGDALRVREVAGETIDKVARDLGLVTKAEYDELELRLAQLEHRLRLLEDRHG